MKQPLLFVVLALAVLFAVYMFFFSSVAPFRINNEGAEVITY